MVSPHNVSKQMEETYRQIQEESGIQINPRHVELGTGGFIPILGSRLSISAEESLRPMLSFTHPHESGARIVTVIHGADGGRLRVRHSSILGNTSLADPRKDSVFTRGTTPEEFRSSFMEHMGKTEEAIRNRGGVDQNMQERTTRTAVHSGMHSRLHPSQKHITHTRGTFDPSGRFTITDERTL